MNSRQKEVQQVQLNDEAKTIRELKQVYKKASDDCAKKIADLGARTDMENLQSIIYQKRYQEALKKQLDAVLDQLNSNSYDKVADYLSKSYDNGFFGAMYDMQGQGIPLIFPVNQDEAVRAIQTDSKISKGVYTKLGEDIKKLKNSIRAELSRGVSNGESWAQIAGHIANGMNTPFQKAYNNAARIARTEGHRVQQTATLDCQRRAKSKGADVVKQWDSTLDGKTRPAHRALDGQIQEIEKPFKVEGMEAMYPSGFGDPSQDCNCRCCLLQRARWALTDKEYTKMNGDTGELVKLTEKGYDKFRQNAADVIQDQNPSKIRKALQETKIAYNEVKKFTKQPSDQEIIERLGGGDLTTGSCSSLAFAYIGNKNGLDVLDFRSGKSREFFSQDRNIYRMLDLTNVRGNVSEVEEEISGAIGIIKNLEMNKEYYLATGRHAAIVRNTEHGAEYLELQSGNENGWKSFDQYGSMYDTLNKRFGCRKTVDKLKLSGKTVIFKKPVTVMDVDSFKDNAEFQKILGYINTAADKQKKGATGHVR